MQKGKSNYFVKWFSLDSKRLFRETPERNLILSLRLKWAFCDAASFWCCFDLAALVDGFYARVSNWISSLFLVLQRDLRGNFMNFLIGSASETTQSSDELNHKILVFSTEDAKQHNEGDLSWEVIQLKRIFRPTHCSNYGEFMRFGNKIHTLFLFPSFTSFSLSFCWETQIISFWDFSRCLPVWISRFLSKDGIWYGFCWIYLLWTFKKIIWVHFFVSSFFVCKYQILGRNFMYGDLNGEEEQLLVNENTCGHWELGRNREKGHSRPRKHQTTRFLLVLRPL